MLNPVPHYGEHTICCPSTRNVPDQPPDSEEIDCPYCGDTCWLVRREAEVKLLFPGGVTYACTSCGLRRGMQQREMDRKRWEEESR